jgi:hypothetical protein
MRRRSFLALAAVPTVALLDHRAFAGESRQTRYQADIAALAAVRVKLAKRHRDAKTASKKRAVLERAEQRLLEAFDAVLFPAWRGTPWDFNGTSTVPGTGHIACGYFVTTLLRDAGVRIERAKLAQQASERIVKALCPAKSIWRFRKGDESGVVDSIQKEGTGLYVVGLDNHVGYLRVGEKARFWHSSYLEPAVVTGEDPKKAAAFESNYHVVGKLFTPSLLERWLAGSAIETPSS